MKFLIYFIGFSFFAKSASFGQKDTAVKVPNIAVFTPLFLDSTFNEKGYKYGKMIPSFAIQGTEFYFGAKKAMDSLNAEKTPINYYIFDSKSSIKTLGTLIANGELAKMDMFIGSIPSTADVKLLADYALKMKIPFISATLPNDAGITNNPNMLIINSTLKTNCKAVHELVKNKLSDQRIVVISKEGKQEERIVGYFKEFEKNTLGGSLAINYIDLGKDISIENIAKNFDSTVLNTFIVASTDVAFAKNIATAVINSKLQDQISLIGLPTWDDAVEFNKKEYTGIHFYYATPMLKPTNSLAIGLANLFKSKYGSTASDNMYRGYETVYKFSKLLIKHKTNLVSNLGDKSFVSLFPLDVQPVMLNPNSMNLDYFENKKVCLMSRFNGVTKAIMQ